MTKLLMVIKVKPEFRDEYIDIHLNPWKEMLTEIKTAGFTNELIWYYDDQSIIYLECSEEDMDIANQKLRTTMICKKWDAKVMPWFAQEPVIPPKIFDLNEMLDSNEK